MSHCSWSHFDPLSARLPWDPLYTMFLLLQVTIYIISCHSFSAVWSTKWSMHQWSAINPYCPHFSSLLCQRLFDIELQCQLHCLFPIAHLNTWGQSQWKTIDWHKTGKAVFACDCDLESKLWSIIVFQFLTLRFTIAIRKKKIKKICPLLPYDCRLLCVRKIKEGRKQQR